MRRHGEVRTHIPISIRHVVNLSSIAIARTPVAWQIVLAPISPIPTMINHSNSAALRIVAAFASLCLFGTDLTARQPNVVVVLTDDQGWGDLSLNGNTNLKTPNIDSLARDGAQFDRFFVCPVCSPTRAEFLTGRYHLRSGVYSTSAGGERLDLDESTIAEAFQDAGYATAAFGKWHNGMQYPYHPNGRGFDEFYGFCSGHWGNYFSPPLEQNGRIVQGNGFVIDDFTDHALEFITQHREDPFFAYLAFNTPHSPMQVPDVFWDRFAQKDLPLRHREPERERLGHTRAALAMCENIDWNVGRLLQHLDSLQLSRETIVVYFCDNGPNGSRWNGGMKGRKGSTDEGGVRSPLLVRWPGTIKSGHRIPQISAAIDLLPTLTDLAGIPPRQGRPLDGTSLKPLLLDEPHPWPNRLLFSRWRDRSSVRSQQFRLDHRGALFNIDDDPGQYHDVSQEYPFRHRQLRDALNRWNDEMTSEIASTERPFLIGHPDYASTQMPARDAKEQGDIKRSNRFPNCSFFTEWRDPDDFITWNAEVLTRGDYAVDLYYACAEKDLGATIALSWKNARLNTTINKANDPPLAGAEHDRIVRAESYVRDFKPLRMGVIALEKGRGTLRLQATKIPGDEAMDFRLLMLTRVDRTRSQ